MILLDLNKQQLQEFLQENLGVKKFVADQVFTWLNKGASFDQMTNVSLATRQKLAEIAIDKPSFPLRSSVKSASIPLPYYS